METYYDLAISQGPTLAQRAKNFLNLFTLTMNVPLRPS
jgi:hypothetical protein